MDRSEVEHMQMAIDALPSHLTMVWSKLVLGGYTFVYYRNNTASRHWKCMLNDADIATDGGFTSLLSRLERLLL